VGGKLCVGAHKSHVYWTVLTLNPVGQAAKGGASARLRSHRGKGVLNQHSAAVAALREEGITDQRVAITASPIAATFPLGP
jgi:hypothetical protein